MNIGIVVFPGSNCDHDCYYVCKHLLSQPTTYLWHKDRSLRNIDLVILPGGFSYGDYLRAGAIARFSPIMSEVFNFANKGGYVLGICNGFQILLESGLLPGAMLRNHSLRFECRNVSLRVERADTNFTNQYITNQVIEIPIAHGEGNYLANDNMLKDLNKNGQILFRYSTPEGEISSEINPNGSVSNIAGIINKNGNILGMMPHPERCSDRQLGSTDGIKLFRSLLNSF